MIRSLFILLFSLAWVTVLAQKERIKAHQGNQAYENGEYDEAAELYEDALEANPDFAEGAFNKGNALQKKADQEMAGKDPKQLRGDTAAMKRIRDLNRSAAEAYDLAAEKTHVDSNKAKAYYNKGNALLKSGALKESIEAYKNSLRKDPDDEDARYNLAYAMRMLEKQKQKQKQQQKEQKNQQNQQQNNQSKDQQQKKKDQQSQQQQNQEQKGNKNQGDKKQSRPEQLSQQEAEQILRALRQNEKEVQEKVREKRLKGTPIKTEKDW